MPSHDTHLPSCLLFSRKHLSAEEKVAMSTQNNQIWVASKQKHGESGYLARREQSKPRKGSFPVHFISQLVKPCFRVIHNLISPTKDYKI